MARSLFAGRPGDFIAVAPHLNGGTLVAAAGLTTGTVWTAAVGGMRLTDLQTVAGVAITGGNVSTDIDGYLVPFLGPSGVDRLWVDFGYGRRLVESQDFATNIATAVFNAGVVSVTAALTGAGSGLAQLDSTGHLPDSEAPIALSNRVAALETAPPVVGSPSGAATPIFTWPYSSGSSNAMVSGNATEVFEVPFNGTIATGPLIQMDDYSTTATVVDVERFDTNTSTFSSIYAGTLPTVPAGTSLLKGAAPVAQGMVKGDLIRMRLVTAPAPGSAGLTAATHPSTTGTVGYGDGATLSVTSHTITMPTDGAAGDTVLLIVPNAIFGTLPTGWVTVASLNSTPNARLNMSILAAPWSASMANTFTLTTTAPLLAAPVLLRNVDIASIGQVVFSSPAEQVGAGVFTTPAFTATAAADFLILFAGTHFAIAIDGYRQTWAASGGPAGMTKTFDLLTTRGAANFDWGLGQGFASGVAAGASVPGQPITCAGGTGSLANTSFISGVIAVKRTTGSHGPSRISAQLTVQAG